MNATVATFSSLKSKEITTSADTDVNLINVNKSVEIFLLADFEIAKHALSKVSQC